MDRDLQTATVGLHSDIAKRFGREKAFAAISGLVGIGIHHHGGPAVEHAIVEDLDDAR